MNVGARGDVVAFGMKFWSVSSGRLAPRRVSRNRSRAVCHHRGAYRTSKIMAASGGGGGGGGGALERARFGLRCAWLHQSVKGER